MLALVLRLCAALALATMLMLVKLGHERGLGLAHMMLFRQALSLPIIFGWMAMTGTLGRMRTSRLTAHGFRAGVGMIGMVLNFLSPILLPLAVATTLGFTSPIFAVVIAGLFLKETVGIWRWTAVILGFVGILLIAQPGGGAIPLVGALVAIGGAFMIAIISAQIRDLAQTEDSLAIVAYFAVFATPPLLIVSLFFEWPTDFADYAFYAAIAVAGTMAQVLLTLSLRFGKVSSVLVMDYTMLVWATIYGFVIFGNLPPATLWLGAPLVVGAGLIIVWRESRLVREPVGIRDI